MCSTLCKIQTYEQQTHSSYVRNFNFENKNKPIECELTNLDSNVKKCVFFDRLHHYTVMCKHIDRI